MFRAKQQLIEHMTPMESKPSGTQDMNEDAKIVKEGNVVSGSKATPDQYANSPSLMATARLPDGDEETLVEAVQETPLNTPIRTPLQTGAKTRTEPELKTASRKMVGVPPLLHTT